MSWYAIFLKTGNEDAVEQYIKYYFDNSECHPVVPKSRLIEKTKGKYYEVLKPLFPGYLLVDTIMNEYFYYKIKQIPNVYRILCQSGEYYTQIHDEEMEPILQLINKENIIDYSKILIEDSKVFVNSGPLKGLEGFIRKLDKRKGRAKLSLHFMGTIKEVELGVEILTPSYDRNNDF